MITLAEIKANLTQDQRAVINAIWECHIANTDKWVWAPPSTLYRKFANLNASRSAGRGFVMSALRSLSGSIIYEHEDHYYGLTLIGVLLTDDGQDGIDLLSRCLECFRVKHDSGLSLEEINISSEELATSLNLSKDRLRLLYELIGLSHLANEGGTVEQWTVRVTPWRDDFLSEDDLSNYIERNTLKSYDPTLPVEHNARSRYKYEKQNKGNPSEFDFIRNPGLKELLEEDWKEAQAVYHANAWKSCVIICGSILEGILFDILSKDEPKSLAAYAALPTTRRSASSISDLNLASLVDVANSLNFLPPGTFHLGHALRHSRNLVHPEKQLRENIAVTEEEANIAISSVRILLRTAATI